MKILKLSLLIGVLVGCASKSPKTPENLQSQGAKGKSLEVGTLSFEGLKDSFSVSSKDKIKGRLKIKGNSEGQVNKVYLFLNRNLVQFIEIEDEASFQIVGDFLKGPNILSAVISKPDGAAHEMVTARDQILFNVNDSQALTPESSARLAKNEGFLLVSPNGNFGSDKAMNIPFQVLNLEPKQSGDEILRYSLNGETRQVQGKGPFSFQNLPPGRYQLKVWRVDKKGSALEGSYFYSAETEFVISQ